MEKLDQLKNYFREKKKVLLCYSGGVDSTFLMSIGKQTIGDNLIAVLFDVPMMTQRMKNNAFYIAEYLGGTLIEFNLEYDDLNGILNNNHDRCYICKKTMYYYANAIARDLGIDTITNGDNFDDDSSLRPGMAASEEYNIQSPLRIFEFTRNEILSQLSKHDFPVPLVKETCMLMRFPEDQKIDEFDIILAASIDEELRNFLDFIQLRARIKNNTVFVQTSKEELPILEKNERLIKEIVRKYDLECELVYEPYEG